jgi:hypothetical protein
MFAADQIKQWNVLVDLKNAIVQCHFYLFTFNKEFFRKKRQ